jgi:oxidase EvaA
MEVGLRAPDRSLSRRDDVLTWFAARRARPGFAVERVPFVECKGLRFDDGRLGHATRRFFSVIGLSARSRFPGLEDWEQPIIDQPEVGILGFLEQLH